MGKECYSVSGQRQLREHKADHDDSSQSVVSKNSSMSLASCGAIDTATATATKPIDPTAMAIDVLFSHCRIVPDALCGRHNP